MTTRTKEKITKVGGATYFIPYEYEDFVKEKMKNKDVKPIGFVFVDNKTARIAWIDKEGKFDCALFPVTYPRLKSGACKTHDT